MTNQVQPQVDGPLKVTGEIELLSAAGKAIPAESEVWLCRCGRSASKPFCDSSHKAAAFSDPVRIAADYKVKVPDGAATGDRLTITLKPNGPLRAVGRLEVLDAAGSVAWSGTQANFCRCGQSRNKPFCDGSHRASGFEAP